TKSGSSRVAAFSGGGVEKVPLVDDGVGLEEDSVRCLQGLKNTFKDPNNRLTSWSFSGDVCRLDGVSCFDDNRVIGLQLSSLELGGEIPDSLQFCKSLVTLNLSNNTLSGAIPSQICEWLPYLVNLDLSNNHLSGPVPQQLVKCKYLKNLLLSDNSLSGPLPYKLPPFVQALNLSDNSLSGSIPSRICHWYSPIISLDLSRNRLSGQIPPELVTCNNLKTLVLSYNHLSGPVPNQLSRFIQGDSSMSFGNNKGLCADFEGLPSCHSTSKKHKVIMFILFDESMDHRLMACGLWLVACGL
ncbi:hypothetical protein IFM89_000775, partial [Coptis chinensis]